MNNPAVHRRNPDGLASEAIPARPILFPPKYQDLPPRCNTCYSEIPSGSLVPNTARSFKPQTLTLVIQNTPDL